MTEQESRFTDPDTAVDHVRRVARETATASGHRAAAFAVMDLRREYRILPLQQKKVATDRLATWQAVRMETRSLVPMAMGGTTDRALFDERVATPAGHPLPQQPGWAPDPSLALQAAALRATAHASPPHRPVRSPGPDIDRTPRPDR